MLCYCIDKKKKETNYRKMPKFMAMHKKRIQVAHKRMGLNPILKKCDFEGGSLEKLHFKAEPVANSILEKRTESADDALQENTAKKLRSFRTKRAKSMAESSPATPLANGAGLVLNNISTRPRYLNEKKKGNIKFSID